MNYLQKIKDKFLENIKNNKYIWFTFIIACFIFLIVYALKSVIPIGKNTLLTVDFYHQYGPLLSELYDKIKNGEDLIYSFNTGLGLPFFRNFYNYLSSPFNVIMLLFGRDNIVTSFSIIIALKIIFSSCIMTYFLKKFFNKNSILTTIFGLTYGFSSYFVAFYWNIMWLDGLVFLPLVILGIKKLIDENKINLYIITLFLSIISNYFISYMICIFSCLFFVVYIIFKENITRKDLIKKIFLFTISSLIAGGIAAFMLLPYLSSLSTISATGDKFAFSKTFNFNLIDFFANNFSLVDTTVFSSQDNFLPNISCGIIPLILVFCFYFNGEIKLKYKIMASIFLVLIIGSFIYAPLDFIWHGFHTPNDLPFRYSFIYVFIINIIAFYSLSKIKTLKIKYSIIIFIIMIAFLIYLSFSKFLTQFAIDINILFLLVSLAMFIIYIIKNNNVGKYIILFLVCTDIILNIDTNWDINHDKNIFMDNYVSVNSTISNIKEQDNSLYRIEKSFNQTLNDGAWYDYNGVSIFSSVAYEQMAKIQKKIGIPGNNINSYYYRQNTPIYNSIMSIKYFVNLENENSSYSHINTINYFEIYKNNYFLPVAFAVSNDINNWFYGNLNPFLNQQSFVKNSTGIENIFDKLSITYDENQENYKLVNDMIINYDQSSGAVLHITPKYSGNVYLYVYNYNLDNFAVNNKLYSVTTNEPYIIDVGYFEKDSDIEVRVPLNEKVSNVDILSYQMNKEKFEEFYKILNNEALQIINYKDNYIEGIISTSDDKVIFTSIPFDTGFKVYIDDKEVETYKIANSFLAFDITEGIHNIKIIYNITHLNLGLIISGSSILLLIVLNIIFKLKRNIKKDC